MVRYQIILALLVSSCGYQQPRREVNGNEYRIESEEFNFYIDRFERLSLDKRPQLIENLIMRFGDLESPTAAICNFQFGKTPIVTIDEKFWKGATDAGRENLIFHELGHCILLRGHLTRKDQGLPVSLMFPSLFPFHYEKNKQPYINELYSIQGDWFDLVEETDRTWSCGESIE